MCLKHQVTVGLSATGQLPWLRSAFLIPAQLIASMCAGGLVSTMFSLGNEDIINITSVNTTLSPGITTPKGLFIEMFLTAELVFVILMLAVEKSRATFIAPLGVGLALLVAELAGKSTLLHKSGGFSVVFIGMAGIVKDEADEFSPQAFIIPAVRSTRPEALAVPWLGGASPIIIGSTG